MAEKLWRLCQPEPACFLDIEGRAIRGRRFQSIIRRCSNPQLQFWGSARRSDQTRQASVPSSDPGDNPNENDHSTYRGEGTGHADPQRNPEDQDPRSCGSWNLLKPEIILAAPRKAVSASCNFNRP